MKAHLILLFVIVLTAGPFFMIPTARSNALTDDSSSVLVDDELQIRELVMRETPELSDKIASSMMFFTPMPSQENSISYVCRKGVSDIAYFGISKVYYHVDDTTFLLEFPGSQQVAPVGEEPTGSITNYLYDKDTNGWTTGLKDCAVLRYRELYSGIDLVYRIHNGMIKYEFVVSPHADPRPIRLRYSDADTLSITDNSITISRKGCMFKDTGLTVFQSVNNAKQDIPCSFKKVGSNEVAFLLSEYDTTKTLVIDPLTVVYSTYLGGSGNEECTDIAVENESIYVTGYRKSPATDSFVIKLASNGQFLVYSTYFSFGQSVMSQSIAVEDSFAYVVGNSTTTGLVFRGKLAVDGQSWVYSPIEVGFFTGFSDVAVEDGFAYVVGGVNSSGILINCVWKYNPSGSEIYFSILAPDTFGHDIAVENGFAYVTGQTFSTIWYVGFPTGNAIDDSYGGAGDSFIVKLTADGTDVLYGTYLGGAQEEIGTGIAVEDDVTYVILSAGGGETSRILKVPTNGNPIQYNTSLDGSGDDYACAIAVDNGIAFVTGYTNSSDFPMVNAYNSTYGGGFDCFMTALSHNGSISHSMYLGGSNNDYGYGIAIGSAAVFVAGGTLSDNFPMVNAYNSTHGGLKDCFIAGFSVDTDFDGLNDWQERVIGTNPFLIDSDNDNFLDGYEVAYGSDPTDPMSYPAMPQAWYDSIYTNLDGNATLIQNLITWSAGNSTLLYAVMQQLNKNATLLTQVIAWLDGNHTTIETLFGLLDGNATILMQTVNALNNNATLIQNLITWSADNSTLLQTMIQQLESNATLLTQVITWLDGNHTAIETLFAFLDENATILMKTIDALQGNVTLIQNLITWSNGNATLLQDVIQQLEGNATQLTQVISWLDGNHTAIETLFTFLEENATILMAMVNALNGNATLIQNIVSWSNGNHTLLQAVIQQLESNATLVRQAIALLDESNIAIRELYTFVEGNATVLIKTVNALNGNSTQLYLIAALATLNTAHINQLNASMIGNISLIRAILNDLGITVGDTDYDGLDDLDEIAHGTDIHCIDTDTDNLNDAFEVKIGTNPLNDDTDGDTYLDGIEMLMGSDPLNAADYPGSGTIPFEVLAITVIGVSVAGFVILLVLVKKKTWILQHVHLPALRPKTPSD